MRAQIALFNSAITLTTSYLMFNMPKPLVFFVLFGMSLMIPSRCDVGIWSLISISKCEEEAELTEVHAVVEVEKHKLNRTHDGINANISVTHDLDENYAIFVDVCKYVDGGCKQYQVLSDDSFSRFVKKYSKKNMEEALTMAKLDPPDFPIPTADYVIENYVMNYCDLPRKAVYGKFEATTFLLFEQERVACVKTVLEFNEFEDENYCGDD